MKWLSLRLMLIGLGSIAAVACCHTHMREVRQVSLEAASEKDFLHSDSIVWSVRFLAGFSGEEVTFSMDTIEIFTFDSLFSGTNSECTSSYIVLISDGGDQTLYFSYENHEVMSGDLAMPLSREQLSFALKVDGQRIHFNDINLDKGKFLGISLRDKGLGTYYSSKSAISCF